MANPALVAPGSLTLDQFVTLHLGKYVDFDGYYGPQCVDLIDYYLVEVLNIPLAYANAVDWYGKDATYLTWTKNVWGNVNSKPNKGDIVVWGPNILVGIGTFGHIAICVDPGDGIHFTTYDQNWGNGVCKLVTHTYDGVIGWGDRPKPVDPCESVKNLLAASQMSLVATQSTLTTTQASLATSNALVATLQGKLSRANGVISAAQSAQHSLLDYLP